MLLQNSIIVPSNIKKHTHSRYEHYKSNPLFIKCLLLLILPFKSLYVG